MKREPHADSHRAYLSDEQLSVVVDLYYADLDANCWFVGVNLSHGETLRIAVDGEAAALDLARVIAADVEKLRHRTVPVRRQ